MILQGILIEFPPATQIIANIGAYSRPIIADLMPFMWFILGIGLAVGILRLLIDLIDWWADKKGKS